MYSQYPSRCKEFPSRPTTSEKYEKMKAIWNKQVIAEAMKMLHGFTRNHALLQVESKEGWLSGKGLRSTGINSGFIA